MRGIGYRYYLYRSRNNVVFVINLAMNVMKKMTSASLLTYFWARNNLSNDCNLSTRSNFTLFCCPKKIYAEHETVALLRGIFYFKFQLIVTDISVSSKSMEFATKEISF